MAKQQIDPSQIDPISSLPGSLLGVSTISSFSGIDSATYIPGSNLTVTMPPGRTTMIIYVSLSLINSTVAAAQITIQLRDGLNGGGSVLTRRVPTTARQYSDGSLSFVRTGLTPGATYNYSLLGNTSTGAVSFGKDTSSTDQIYAVLA